MLTIVIVFTMHKHGVYFAVQFVMVSECVLISISIEAWLIDPIHRVCHGMTTFNCNVRKSLFLHFGDMAKMEPKLEAALKHEKKTKWISEYSCDFWKYISSFMLFFPSLRVGVWARLYISSNFFSRPSILAKKNYIHWWGLRKINDKKQTNRNAGKSTSILWMKQVMRGWISMCICYVYNNSNITHPCTI